eukprot:scaffold4374_cov165-Amphora_coffeaeformis.AAC.3
MTASITMDLIVPQQQQQHGVSDDDDHSATMPVHDLDKNDKGHCELLVRRSVRFDETKNRYYEAPFISGAITATSLKAILKERWWSPADYEVFEQNTRRQLQCLQVGYNPWTASWLKVYFTLRLAQCPQEFQHVLASTPLILDEYTAGFQGTQLEPIYADFQVRRESLLVHIHHVQTTAFREEDAIHRAALIEQTSRLHSHAARLYAHIAGLSLAASVDK